MKQWHSSSLIQIRSFRLKVSARAHRPRALDRPLDEAGQTRHPGEQTSNGQSSESQKWVVYNNTIQILISCILSKQYGPSSRSSEASRRRRRCRAVLQAGQSFSAVARAALQSIAPAPVPLTRRGACPHTWRRCRRWDASIAPGVVPALVPLLRS